VILICMIGLFMICSKKDGLSKEDQFLMKLYCGCMTAVVLYTVVSSCEPHHVTLVAITRQQLLSMSTLPSHLPTSVRSSVHLSTTLSENNVGDDHTTFARKRKRNIMSWEKTNVNV